MAHPAPELGLALFQNSYMMSGMQLLNSKRVRRGWGWLTRNGAGLLPLLALLGTSGCQTSPTAEPARTTSTMERVLVAPDGQSFQLAESKAAFRPWGLNYGNAGRLLEDYWERDWGTVVRDFREMKALGANVVRVHLQFGRFMDSPSSPNSAALNRLGRLLQLAEQNELYLDLTGLGCYRKADVPRWYDALPEPARWEAQAVFWRAVAERAAVSRAVFCYNLMNEPLAPAEKRDPEAWYPGRTFGGYDFLQYIALDPGGRSREEVASAWIGRMKAAIRQHDPATLITVGLLPWVKSWGHLSGFIPARVAGQLDFLSVHIYPASDKPDEARQALQECVTGKPVVIEETFPLSCSPQELETFLHGTRATASGWMGHYDGTSLEALDQLSASRRINIPQSMMREWLKLFVRLRPDFVGRPTN